MLSQLAYLFTLLPHDTHMPKSPMRDTLDHQLLRRVMGFGPSRIELLADDDLSNKGIPHAARVGLLARFCDDFDRDDVNIFDVYGHARFIVENPNVLEAVEHVWDDASQTYSGVRLDEVFRALISSPETERYKTISKRIKEKLKDV